MGVLGGGLVGASTVGEGVVVKPSAEEVARGSVG